MKYRLQLEEQGIEWSSYLVAIELQKGVDWPHGHDFEPGDALRLHFPSCSLKRFICVILFIRDSPFLLHGW